MRSASCRDPLHALREHHDILRVKAHETSKKEKGVREHFYHECSERIAFQTEMFSDPFFVDGVQVVAT